MPLMNTFSWVLFTGVVMNSVLSGEKSSTEEALLLLVLVRLMLALLSKVRLVLSKVNRFYCPLIPLKFTK